LLQGGKIKAIILSAFIILYLLCSACHQRDAENEKPAAPNAGTKGNPLDPWVQQQVDWLSEAAEKGETEKVMAFLDAGVPIDAFDSDGFTALMVACLHGKLQMAKLLIARGADFRLERKKGYDVITAAAFSKNVELMKFFLKKILMSLLSTNAMIHYYITLLASHQVKCCGF
jgi:hypothetical protein